MSYFRMPVLFCQEGILWLKESIKPPFVKWRALVFNRLSSAEPGLTTLYPQYGFLSHPPHASDLAETTVQLRRNAFQQPSQPECH